MRQYDVDEFHMKKASRCSVGWGRLPKQTLAERNEALKPFADCISENLEFGLLQAWDVKGFGKIPSALRVNVGNPDDPYYLAFVRHLVELVDYGQNDDVFSVICDEEPEKALICHAHYNGVRRAHPQIRKKTASLSFANSKHFLPLQAADMAAFLARHEARVGFYGMQNEWRPLFHHLVLDRGPSKMQWTKMFANEEQTKNCLKPPKRRP